MHHLLALWCHVLALFASYPPAACVQPYLQRNAAPILSMAHTVHMMHL